MPGGPDASKHPKGCVLLDTDTLSELSRGNPIVSARARAYLTEYGRLTISAITVFERLRGYREAIAAGKAFQRQLQAFETLVQASVVLPFDETAADVAATVWSGSARKARQNLGDLLIAAVAIARQLPLVTRNKRDFELFAHASGVRLRLVDWARATTRK
jgi:predicted nucleic acid-binding protein